MPYSDKFSETIGSFVNGVTGKNQQMEFNSAEAEKQRNWQEHMSNTQHQREILDMQAAGINPALTAMGGNGAGTPSGASANGPGGGSNILAGIGTVLHAAAQLGQGAGSLSTKAKIYNESSKLLSNAVTVAKGLGFK